MVAGYEFSGLPGSAVAGLWRERKSGVEKIFCILSVLGVLVAINYS